jgi:RNA polymerase sigma-70 factor (ECF subfamily)
MSMTDHRFSEPDQCTAGDPDEDSSRPGCDLDRLLVLSARGDQAAFRRLYDATSGKLLAQAIAMMRSRSAAEDVLQDAYIRVWDRARSFDPGRGPALPWLVRLLRNVAVDHLRRQRIAAGSCDWEGYARDLAAPAAPVEDRIDLVDALARLSDVQRHAVTAVVVEGWTNEQAARRGGMPTATSKARVARGLRRMRDYLDTLGQPAAVAHVGTLYE